MSFPLAGRITSRNEFTRDSQPQTPVAHDAYFPRLSHAHFTGP